MCDLNLYFGIDWKIKPIVSATSIGINMWPTSATRQFICAFWLLSARLCESSTVLSFRLSSRHQTRCVAVGSEFISKLYTIRKFYSVQHSTVYIILT